MRTKGKLQVADAGTRRDGKARHHKVLRKGQNRRSRHQNLKMARDKVMKTTIPPRAFISLKSLPAISSVSVEII